MNVNLINKYCGGGACDMSQSVWAFTWECACVFPKPDPVFYIFTLILFSLSTVMKVCPINLSLQQMVIDYLLIKHFFSYSAYFFIHKSMIQFDSDWINCSVIVLFKWQKSCRHGSHFITEMFEGWVCERERQTERWAMCYVIDLVIPLLLCFVNGSLLWHILLPSLDMTETTRLIRMWH